MTQEEFLAEEDVRDYFDLVEAADRKEVKSFVDHKVFALDLREHSSNTVDATWVRKWTGYDPPTIKSRCCGRGFLDRQKKGVDRHSSTASILSHRLAVSIAAQYGWALEAFDVSTAFLRGLKFSEIEEKAHELGVECRQTRQVWLRPPANMWRHLRLLGFCRVEDFDRHLFLLQLLKAMYGLVDGPILFQMAFLHHLTKVMGFHKSLHDENFLYVHDGSANLCCCIVVHVDDLLIAAPHDYIRYVQQHIEKRFGTLKQHSLPFTWCGIVHQRLDHNPQRVEPDIKVVVQMPLRILGILLIVLVQYAVDSDPPIVFKKTLIDRMQSKK